MQRIKEKLKQIQLPINSGTLGLFISLLAVGYVASAVQSPCLQAQATCAVGGESVFNENIQIKGGTTYAATLDASGITSDRTITIPNASGTILLGGGLSGSKVVATDVSGELTTTEIYPLSIGTSGQILTVDATNSFLEYSSITGVPSLSVSKSVSTDGTGALTTNDVYPLSLTASKVAKTDVSGNLTTGQIDVTTDVIAGTSLQQIRTNAGATGTEWFTPSGGGGAWSEVASGSVTTGLTSQITGTEAICFGVSIANNKRYKLWFNGGNEDNYGSTYSPAYNSYFIPLINDCTTDYDPETSTNYITGGFSAGSVSNANVYGSNEGFCYVDGGYINAYNKVPMQTNGTIIFHGKNSTTGSEGFQAYSNISGMVNNGSGSQAGHQFGQMSCSDRADYNTGLDITTITGIGLFIEQVASSGRTWVLWESTN